jgi:hypothetical protein
VQSDIAECPHVLCEVLDDHGRREVAGTLTVACHVGFFDLEETCRRG